MSSQRVWSDCLYWAAHHGYRLRQAVIFYQKRMRTRDWPSGVTPAPPNDPVLLNTRVASLWPEYTHRQWVAK